MSKRFHVEPEPENVVAASQRLFGRDSPTLRDVVSLDSLPDSEDRDILQDWVRELTPKFSLGAVLSSRPASALKSVGSEVRDEILDTDRDSLKHALRSFGVPVNIVDPVPRLLESILEELLGVRELLERIAKGVDSK